MNSECRLIYRFWVKTDMHAHVLNQQSSIQRARDAYVVSTRVPAKRLPNLEKRHSALYVAELSCRLGADEMRLLNDATNLRENALSLARDGQTDAAQGLIDEAQEFVDKQLVSDEGKLSAMSFHMAAASFVTYVSKDIDTAMVLLTNALKCCQRLKVDYNHNVEMRRVHLARNIVRLQSEMRLHQLAWDTCEQLLCYVWNNRVDWPLDKETNLPLELRSDLRNDEKVHLSDQLLSELLSVIVTAEKHSVKLNCYVLNEQLASATGQVVATQSLCEQLVLAGKLVSVSAFTDFFNTCDGTMPLSFSRAAYAFNRLVGEPVA